MHHHFRNILAASLFAAALSAPAWLSAHEYKAGNLLIAHPWTRATPSGAKTAAGYMIITNSGKEADKLTGATTEGADQVELHEMSMGNSIMKMRQLRGGIEIAPGAKVELNSGSYHLMMIGLKSGFKEGQMVRGTLKFEKAGSVPVEFKVEAMGGGGSDHSHMN